MTSTILDALTEKVARLCAAVTIEDGMPERAMLASIDALDEDARWRLFDAPPSAWHAWLRVESCSVYAREQLQRHPGWLLELLYAQPAPAAPDLTGVEELDMLQERLRLFRHRHILDIIWRDLTEPDAYPRTVAALTRLAECCLQSALDCLWTPLRRRHGIPRDAQGKPVSFVVLGMGKLGGAELNLSSDIDLIFAYGGPGSSDGPQPLENAEYFHRLARQLIQALSAVTAAGFVFRVDMRLRPFGESGPLVISEAGMEQYYLMHGREWERFAFIKARPVAGDRTFGDALLANLHPFVFRRYLDFTALAALRDLKRLIDAEVRRKERAGNIKLGPGGIREIEFIVQVFQLIHGGRIAALRGKNTLTVLQTLDGHHLMPRHDIDKLHIAYLFLRNLEHRLQMAHDRQTHALPVTPLEQARTALAMGYPDWATLHRAIEQQRTVVSQHFDLTFAAPQADLSQQDAQAQRVWLWASEQPDLLDGRLQTVGFPEGGSAERHLRGFAQSHLVRRRLGASARARLDQLMPLVIALCGQSPMPDELLLRFIHLIESAAGRSAYLALLIENPVMLSRLGRLLLLSPWIAHALTQYPDLLDEVLDGRTGVPDTDGERYRADLADLLAQEPDVEARIEQLRIFKRIRVFHLARAELLGLVTAEEVRRGLSNLAASLLEVVLAMAWNELVRKFGVPRQAGGLAAQFCIVGMGKLGSGEMSYHSDLDLLFLHDSQLEAQTDGDRRIPNLDFFARLGQRIIYHVSTLTPAGTLYSIDMRLRPSGRAGPLVTSLSQLEHYQRHEAWTWEHQALTRARAITGSPLLQNAFEALRLDILSQRRPAPALRQDVGVMRARMLAENKVPEGRFSLKQSSGGLIDIEFLVQYGRLLYGSDAPDLLAQRDTRSGLQALAQAGLWSTAEAGALAEALNFYRALESRLQLLERPPVFSEDEAPSLEALLPRAFQSLWASIEEHRARVRQIWDMHLSP